MRVRVGTYNLLDFHHANVRWNPDEHDRYRLIPEVIRSLNVDVLMVQEICGLGRDTLLRLAKDTGLDCCIPSADPEDAPDEVVIAHASGLPHPKFHVGVLWNPEIFTPRRGSYRNLDGELWHNAVAVSLEGGEVPLRAVAYHGNPFGRNAREDEYERLAAFLTRSYGHQPHTIIGADRNTILADRVRDDDGTWRDYHPDPYTPQPWRQAFIHQCQWAAGPDGTPDRWWADRRPGKVMLANGLRDTAALRNTPWTRTVGHYHHADMGDRAIDGHQVTPALAPAVVDHEVIENDLTRQASDHLPVISTLDLALARKD